VPRPFPGPKQERPVRRQVSWLAGQGLMHAFPGLAFMPFPSGRPLPGKGHVHRAHRLQLQGQPRIRQVAPPHRIPFQAPRGAPARVCRSAGFGARPLAWRAAIANRFVQDLIIAMGSSGKATATEGLRSAPRCEMIAALAPFREIAAMPDELLDRGEAPRARIVAQHRHQAVLAMGPLMLAIVPSAGECGLVSASSNGFGQNGLQ